MIRQASKELLLTNDIGDISVQVSEELAEQVIHDQLVDVRAPELRWFQRLDKIDKTQRRKARDYDKRRENDKVIRLKQ